MPTVRLHFFKKSIGVEKSWKFVNFVEHHGNLWILLEIMEIGGFLAIRRDKRR